jgi:phospholipid-binding lipoprotein MlaA
MNAGFSLRAARQIACVAILASVALLTGCATTRPAANSGDGQMTAANEDPLEGFNRAVFNLNDKLDRALFKPIAQGYDKVLPEAVRSCVSNGFGNVADVSASLNNFLQGKFKEGGSDICRVTINSTIGVLGCFDVASKWGFEKHNEDFGQTLGVWGVPSGPYLVIPFFGPSTFRDGPALIVDAYTDPTHYIPFVAWRNRLYLLRLVDKRAQALDTTNFIDNAALDPYVFVRDAFMARRRSLVLDGKEPAPPPTDTPGGDATPPTTGGPPTTK